MSERYPKLKVEKKRYLGPATTCTYKNENGRCSNPAKWELWINGEQSFMQPVLCGTCMIEFQNAGC